MKLIRGLHNINNFKPCIATIGNFDGVHLGHQEILHLLHEKSLALALPSLVIVFEPMPKEFFLGEKAPERLTRLREKFLELKQVGCQEVLCINFNKDFAAMPAEKFIKEVLIDKLQIQLLIVGDDFRFGHQRLGDFKLLKSLGEKYGMEVIATSSIKVNHQRVSSSLVRQALKQGQLQIAKDLLGHDYSMCGRVAHGHQRGRMIGFPTANVYLKRKISPILGVYAVTVEGLAEGKLYGVANVGNRPTVDGSKTLLEIHIFNFHREIYGEQIKVNFIHKIRDEKKYDSFELLKNQILQDAKEAKTYFAID